MQSTLNQPDLSHRSENEAGAWTQLAPLLDDAMAELGETDRTALVLRYFENKSAREIAATLRMEEGAAQKRVARALEKLRARFVKRGVTLTVTVIAGAVAANSVQAAPTAFAAAITATALSGTTITTAAVFAATKSVAMTTFQKTFITVALVATVGAGTFEAHQNSQLHGQNQVLQQQQSSLAEQIQQLSQSLIDATNQLASLLAENGQLKSHSNENELLKLGEEVSKLRTAQTQNKSDSMEVAVKAWLRKINLLKQRLDQRPDLKIPELQFLEERDWLNAANSKVELVSADDYSWDLRQLRDSAEDNFGGMAMSALQRYIQANNRQFPTDLSQLQPYFSAPIDNAILHRYEIVPTKTIPSANYTGSDWLIAQKSPVDGKNDSREVIGPNGVGIQETLGQHQTKIPVNDFFWR